VVFWTQQGTLLAKCLSSWDMLRGLIPFAQVLDTCHEEVWIECNTSGASVPHPASIDNYIRRFFPPFAHSSSEHEKERREEEKKKEEEKKGKRGEKRRKERGKKRERKGRKRKEKYENFKVIFSYHLWYF
jgi:hypothetical protein